jgi:hypothetical protein
MPVISAIWEMGRITVQGQLRTWHILSVGSGAGGRPALVCYCSFLLLVVGFELRASHFLAGALPLEPLCQPLFLLCFLCWVFVPTLSWGPPYLQESAKHGHTCHLGLSTRSVSFQNWLRPLSITSYSLCFPFYFIFVFYFVLFLGSTGVWTQILVLAKPVFH